MKAKTKRLALSVLEAFRESPLYADYREADKKHGFAWTNGDYQGLLEELSAARKPTVIVQVQGGIASCQSLPPNGAETIIVDWDFLKDGGDPTEAMRDAKALIRQIRSLKTRLEDEPKGYLKDILCELKDALEGLAEITEGDDADEEAPQVQ